MRFLQMASTCFMIRKNHFCISYTNNVESISSCQANGKEINDTCTQERVKIDKDCYESGPVKCLVCLVFESILLKIYRITSNISTPTLVKKLHFFCMPHQLRADSNRI